MLHTTCGLYSISMKCVQQAECLLHSMCCAGDVSSQVMVNKDVCRISMQEMRTSIVLCTLPFSYCQKWQRQRQAALSLMNDQWSFDQSARRRKLSRVKNIAMCSCAGTFCCWGQAQGVLGTEATCPAPFVLPHLSAESAWHLLSKPFSMLCCQHANLCLPSRHRSQNSNMIRLYNNTCVITGNRPSGNTYSISLSLSAKSIAVNRLPAQAAWAESMTVAMYTPQIAYLLDPAAVPMPWHPLPGFPAAGRAGLSRAAWKACLITVRTGTDLCDSAEPAGSIVSK